MHYTQVSAGEMHTVLLRSDGRVVAVGNNDYQQCEVSNLKVPWGFSSSEAWRRSFSFYGKAMKAKTVMKAAKKVKASAVVKARKAPAAMKVMKAATSARPMKAVQAKTAMKPAKVPAGMKATKAMKATPAVKAMRAMKA